MGKSEGGRMKINAEARGRAPAIEAPTLFTAPRGVGFGLETEDPRGSAPDDRRRGRRQGVPTACAAWRRGPPKTGDDLEQTPLLIASERGRWAAGSVPRA